MNAAAALHALYFPFDESVEAGRGLAISQYCNSQLVTQSVVVTQGRELLQPVGVTCFDPPARVGSLVWTLT